MTDTRIKFTKEALRKLPAKAADYIVWDTGYNGYGSLGCRVSTKGLKTIFATYRAGDSRDAKQVKKKVMRFDELLRRDELTIDDIRRDVAKQVDEARATGMTPTERKRAAQKDRVWTLRDVALDYAANREKPYADADKPTPERPHAHIGAAFDLCLRRCEATGIADLPITDVKAADLQKLIKGLGGATKRQVRGIMTPWFTHAIYGLEIAGLKNPWTSLRKINKDAVPAYVPRDVVLTDAEMAAFGAAIDEYEATAASRNGVPPVDLCDALRLIAYTGLRKMVVLGARWDEFSDLDVDPVIWTVKVEKGRAKNGEELKVSLEREAADVLRRIRARRDQEGLWARDHERVFCSRASACGHVQEIRFTFNHVLRIAGLQGKGLHLHDLRATWVTSAIDGGASPKDVAAQVGHKNAQVTLGVYDRLRSTPEERASVAAAPISAYRKRPETA